MAAPQTGPDARRTATHLTLALLGYFVLVTAVITLSPFDFSLRRVRIDLRLVPSDIVANIALFLPLGFLGRGLVSGSGRGGRVVWVAAASSLLIETAQIFIRPRYVSPIDVVSNSAGLAGRRRARLARTVGAVAPAADRAHRPRRAARGPALPARAAVVAEQRRHDRGRAPQHDHAAARVCREPRARGAAPAPVAERPAPRDARGAAVGADLVHGRRTAGRHRLAARVRCAGGAGGRR